jgi:hypothetical protein
LLGLLLPILQKKHGESVGRLGKNWGDLDLMFLVVLSSLGIAGRTAGDFEFIAAA